MRQFPFGSGQLLLQLPEPFIIEMLLPKGKETDGRRIVANSRGNAPKQAAVKIPLPQVLFAMAQQKYNQEEKRIRHSVPRLVCCCKDNFLQWTCCTRVGRKKGSKGVPEKTRQGRG